MNEQALSTFYSHLQEQVPSFKKMELSQFEQNISDPQKLSEFYGHLQQQVPSFQKMSEADFRSMIGYDEKPEEVATVQSTDVVGTTRRMSAAGFHESGISSLAEMQLQQQQNATEEAKDKELHERFKSSTPTQTEPLSPIARGPIKNNADFMRRLGISVKSSDELPSDEETKKQANKIRNEYAQEVHDRRYQNKDDKPKDSFVKDLFENWQAGVGEIALTPYKAVEAAENFGLDIENKLRGTNFQHGHGVATRFLNDVLGGNYLRSQVEHYRKEGDRYQDNKGIVETAAEGDLSTAAGKAVLSTIQSAPNLAVSIYSGKKGLETLGGAFLGTTAALQKYDEIKDNDNISNADKALAMFGAFVSECVPEIIGAKRYGKMFNKQAVGTLRKETQKEVMNAWQKFLNSNFMKNSGRAWDWYMKYFGEGTTEAMTDIMNLGIDLALGIKDGVTKQDLMSIGDSFIVGQLSDAIPSGVHFYQQEKYAHAVKKEIEDNPELMFVIKQQNTTPEEVADIASKKVYQENVSDKEEKIYNAYVDEVAKHTNTTTNLNVVLADAGLTFTAQTYDIYSQAVQATGKTEEEAEAILSKDSKDMTKEDIAYLEMLSTKMKEVATAEDVSVVEQPTEATEDVQPKSKTLSTGTKPLEFTVRTKVETRESGKTSDVVKDVKVSFRSDSYTIADDGSILAENYTILMNGKPVTGKKKTELMDAINEQLRSEKQNADIKKAEEAAKQAEADAAAAQEQAAQQQAVAEAEAAAQAEEQRVNDLYANLQQQVEQKGIDVISRFTPEQKFIWTMKEDGLDAAIEDARTYLEAAASEKDPATKRAKLKQWQALLDKYAPAESQTSVVDTPAQVVPSAMEEEQKPVVKPEKKTKKEKAAKEEKPKMQEQTETPKVEAPQQPNVETPAPTPTPEPAPVKPKKARKAPGYEEGMDVFATDVHLTKDAGGRLSLIKSDKMPKNEQRVYLDADGNTPYLLWSSVPITSTRGNIKYVDADGNIQEVSRSSVYMEEAVDDQNKKIVPVPAPQRKNVTSFDSILKAKLKVEGEEYTFGDILKAKQVGSTKKQGGEGIKYLNGYQAIAQHINERTDLTDEQKTNALMEVRRQINEWIDSWNSLAKNVLINATGLKDKDLMPGYAMNLSLYRDVRDKYAKAGDIQKLNDIQAKILDMNFQVSHADETNLTRDSFFNPLYQLTLMVETAQKAGILKNEEQLTTSLPDALQRIANSELVLPKQIEEKRAKYEVEKNRKHKTGSLEEEFPEVKYNLPALIRFAQPKTEKGKRAQSNKWYDKSLANVYKQMDAALKRIEEEKKGGEELAKFKQLLEQAYVLVTNKDEAAVAKANEAILAELEKHKDEPAFQKAFDDAQRKVTKYINSLEENKEAVHRATVLQERRDLAIEKANWESEKDAANMRDDLRQTKGKARAERYNIEHISNEIAKINTRIAELEKENDWLADEYRIEQEVAVLRELDEQLTKQNEVMDAISAKNVESPTAADRKADEEQNARLGQLLEQRTQYENEHPEANERLNRIYAEEKKGGLTTTVQSEMAVADENGIPVKTPHTRLIFETLKKVIGWSGIQLHYVGNQDTAGKILEKIQGTPELESFKAPNGTILGWAIGNEIYLTDEGLNSETPIHEYTHLWVKSLRNEKPEAWEKIKTLLKKNKHLWDDVVNDPAYANIKNDEDAIASELLSRYSGKNGAKRLEEMAAKIAKQRGLTNEKMINSLINNMRNALQEFWRVIRDLFMPNSNVTIDEVADLVLKDLFDGKPLNLNTQEMNEIKEQAIKDGTFMKAPNGRDTKLTERQWLSVRTKAFRQWFGDWMKSGRKGIFNQTWGVYDGVTVSRQEFYPDMAPDGGVRVIKVDGKYIGEIPTIEDDEKITMSGSIGAATEIDKEYRRKGYGKKAHIALALIAAREGRVLYSDSSNSDAEDALWKSLVKDGLAEVIEEKPKEGNWNHTTYRIINETLPSGETHIESEEVGVLDENGEPMVVYHGTDYAGFDELIPQENGVVNGRGIFTTPQRFVAGVYGHLTGEVGTEYEARIGQEEHRGIYSLFANIKNPMVVECFNEETGRPSMWNEIPTGIWKIVGKDMKTQYYDSREDAENAYYEQGWGIGFEGTDLEEPEIVPETMTTDEFVSIAREQGYDGVIFKNIVDGTDSDLLNDDIEDSDYMRAHDVVVGMMPNQFKSAVSNNGMYSQADNRIEYQYAERQLRQLDVPVERRIRKEENKGTTDMLDPDLSGQEQSNWWETVVTRVMDQSNGMRLILNSINAYRKVNGLEPMDMDKFDVRTKYEACRSVVANKIGFLERGIQQELDDTLREFAEKIEDSEFYKAHMKEVGGKNPTTLTPIQFIERYLMARNNWERAKEGVPRGLAEFKERMGMGVIEFSNVFTDAYGEEDILNLWEKIRKMTDFALDTNLEGGLISEELYEELKAKKFYVPQRGFWDDVNPENEEKDEKDLLLRRTRGNVTSRNKLDSMHKAEGGKSLADGCLAYINRDARQAIKLSEENKVKKVMFDLLRENEDWCHEPEHNFKVPRQVFYQDDGEGGIKVMDDGPTDEQRQEMRQLKTIVKQLKEEYLKAETEEEKADIAAEIEATEAQYPYFDEKDSYRILHSRVSGQYDKNGQRKAEAAKAIVGLYINGVPCEMEMTPRFVQTADALNGRRDTRWIISGLKTITSWLSAQFTMNNPTFFAVNITRDTPLILTKGAAEYGPEFSIRFTANWALSQGAIWKYLVTGKVDNTEIGAQLYDFLMNGGNTGYSNLEELERWRRRVSDLNPGGFEALQRELSTVEGAKKFGKAALATGKGLLKVGDKALGWAELRPMAQVLNEWSEIISRFSAYKSVVDMGLGINEGIHAAHNLSTNFNRKGLGGPFINLFNTLTVFANASIQGASGYWRALDTQGDAKEKAKKVAKVAAYMGMLPAFLGFLCTMFNPDDDEYEYMVSEYERDNYVILGDKRFALNEQLKPWWVIGVNIALGLRGKRTADQMRNSIMTSIATNWLPLPQNLTGTINMFIENTNGKEEWNLAQMARTAIMPSAMQTMNQWADNKNFLGGKLRYDIGDIPEYEMAPNEAELYKDIAYVFYVWGGGNELVPSKTKEDGTKIRRWWDVNPKEIKSNTFWIPSGAMDNFCLAYGLAKDVKQKIDGDFTGTNVRTKDLPVINRFYKPSDNTLYRYSVVRQAKDIVKAHDDRVSNLQKQVKHFSDVYAQTGDAKAKASLDDAKRLLVAERKDITVVEMKKILDKYNKHSIRSLQDKLGESNKEVKKLHEDAVGKLDDVEKDLVQRMTEGVNLKTGLRSSKDVPEWIVWFDDHSGARQERREE